MTESANLNRRERRKQQTAAGLTAVSRRMTAAVGLSGFTIEELCDEVDVSRRTFFNYFSSKEDAVIGVNPVEESARFAADFASRGSRGWAAVVDDLVALVIEHFEDSGADTSEHSDFMLALEREPRLMARFIGLSRERDREAAAMIAWREGVQPGDPRAQAAVSLLTALLRTSGEHLLDPTDLRDFRTILTETLAVFRTLLADAAPGKDAS